MRDNAKIHESLIKDTRPGWKFAVVYDEPNFVNLFNHEGTWDYQVATDITGLNTIMLDMDPDLNPEIWTREITVKICPPATYTS